MYHDLESLKQLAGVYDQQGTGQTHHDQINPRKMAALTEQVRRAKGEDGLNKIYNWIQAGNIDTQMFKDLLQVNEAKTIKEDIPDQLVELIVEALEAGIYAIENPDSDQQFAVDAMRDVIRRLGQ